jgi:catechol 2,3-dioxygenase-like lactoylglutathione lyase family enzyme
MMPMPQLPGTKVAPAKLAHVVLRVRQFERAQQWWSDLLGGRVVFANDFLAFLTYDDEHHRLALFNYGEHAADPSDGVGMDHVAFTFASLEDLLNTYVRLRSEGIESVWTINHGPTTSMYYRDPDGIQVELQYDNFPTLDALNEWFATGAFALNPIGIEFDPDDLVRRYEAGESVASLTAWPT